MDNRTTNRCNIVKETTPVPELSESQHKAVEGPWILRVTRTIARHLTDYFILVKMRLTLLVLTTAAVGYILASDGAINPTHLPLTMLWTFCLIGGANALNQVLERNTDALMDRTRNRPLPAGRLSTDEALYVGTTLSIVGLFGFKLTTNALTACLGAIALALYLFAYTPLKRKSEFCTLVGAIPGAIPPLIGWAAVRGELGPGAWALFALQYVWQFPHFWAIAWLYKDDYARANLKMLPVNDVAGWGTARQVMLYSIILLPVSLLPAAVGLAGIRYAIGAIILSGLVITLSTGLLVSRSTRAARRLMAVAILYLPIVLIIMILDQV